MAWCDAVTYRLRFGQIKEDVDMNTSNEINTWATAAVAAMLARVRRVCIWEYEQRIKEISRG